MLMRVEGWVGSASGGDGAGPEPSGGGAGRNGRDRSSTPRGRRVGQDRLPFVCSPAPGAVRWTPSGASRAPTRSVRAVRVCSEGPVRSTRR